MAAWRILVADDEPLVIGMIRDILSRLPVSVLEAKDGEEALHLARGERPDLILLDVMMPRLDGFQVAQILKKDPATAQIPLIFISALGASRDKVRGLNLGAEDYLSKPIEPDELQTRVLSILNRTRAPAQAEAHPRGPSQPPPQVPPPPSAQEPALASGQLQAMDLVSLVQVLEGQRRTARLLLARGAEQGVIAFVDGAIVRAAQGARLGVAAIYQLLAWQEGTFQMAAPDAGSQVGGVTLPIQALLMEGMRRLDEVPGLRASLPTEPLEVLPALRATMPAQGQPEAATLVALLDGTRDLDQVLAESPLDAWMTLKVLHRLLDVRAAVPVTVPSEHRGGPRLTIAAAVEYQRLPLLQKALNCNLSARGMFIPSEAPFEVGEQLIIRFQLPEQESSVKVVGQVVWRNTDPNRQGGTGMGVQFLDLAGSDREGIGRHLARILAEQIMNAGEEA